MGKKVYSCLITIIKGILTIIYPMENKCIICGEDDVEGICKTCINSIAYCNDECSVGYYKGVLKELILKFKYKNDFNCGDILVDLLEDKLKGYEDYIITFIPIGEKALKKRGFNQCEYIAKELAFRKNMNCLNTMIKVKNTKVQKTLTKEERIENLKGAFDLKSGIDIKTKNIILIDDVITTGATLNEGKRVLLDNGANKIKILTVAKSYI